VGPVCDGKNETIGCAIDGQVLTILDAFYGRNDSTTCVEEGEAQGWDSSAWAVTNCSTSKALGILQGWCDGRQSCIVPDHSRHIWQYDPCQYTFKFVMATYTCMAPPGAQQPAWHALLQESPSPGQEAPQGGWAASQLGSATHNAKCMPSMVSCPRRIAMQLPRAARSKSA
jgi:hypothetical protein